MIKSKIGAKMAVASQKDTIHLKDEFHWIYPVFPENSLIKWKIGVKMASASQWDIFRLKDEFHSIYPVWNSQNSSEEIFTIFLHFCLASLL